MTSTVSEYTGWTRGKAQELFCSLLLYGRHPRPRDLLAELLCPGCETEQSRKALRHALWEPQSVVVGGWGPHGADLLVVEPIT